MYTGFRISRWVGLVVVVSISAAVVDAAAAQHSPTPPQQPHQHPAPTTDQKQREQQIPMTRGGSGTAWLPDVSPMYAMHWQRGPWQFMAHGNAFLQFLAEGSDRGDDQFGSINWFMGMAERTVGRGALQLRSMFSLEPATIRGCGYPDLLATGEQCDGRPIHDRQHQHDVFMEIAARYDAPLNGAIRWQAYAGAAGEPALGPVAYPHRISAMANPLAPIGHHWLDSSHITYGVITAGVYANRWKTEASVFNGREPDETRTNVDFASLHSVSGRVWFLPTSQWAFQFSAGRLNEAEPADHEGERVDVTRASASATFHSRFRENSIWATTVAWGRNVEAEQVSNAVLVETNLTFDERHTWFGRSEVVNKAAHDLGLEDSAQSFFTVAKLQGGFTRYLAPWMGLQPGAGATLSASFVPQALTPTYGSRVNLGVGVFVTVRPAANVHAGGRMHDGSRHEAAAGR